MAVSETKTFTFINHQLIAQIIQSADKHIVYAAPGIAETVAQAIEQFSRKSEKVSLRVVVDTDAEAIRLGFGDFSGINFLTEKKIEIRQAKGLRIAVLIADENAWIYSPTPEIIFEQPTAATSNAIRVNKDFALEILQSIAPDISLVENILDASIIPATLQPEIGGEIITGEDIVKIDASLKENPPQKFDAARKVRVYQGYFQFLEYFYKDVTFESLNDKNFIKAIEEKYPFNNFAKLYSEEQTMGKR